MVISWIVTSHLNFALLPFLTATIIPHPLIISFIYSGISAIVFAVVSCTLPMETIWFNYFMGVILSFLFAIEGWLISRIICNTWMNGKYVMQCGMFCHFFSFWNHHHHPHIHDISEEKCEYSPISRKVTVFAIVIIILQKLVVIVYEFARTSIFNKISPPTDAIVSPELFVSDLILFIIQILILGCLGIFPLCITHYNFKENISIRTECMRFIILYSCIIIVLMLFYPSLFLRFCHHLITPEGSDYWVMFIISGITAIAIIIIMFAQKFFAITTTKQMRECNN